MVSSISSSADNSIQLMMAQMYQKMNAADTDGTQGLSKDELSSIDSSNDVGGSAFLKSLSDQFDSLDADGNGQLSASEIASAKPPSGPMGPPPGMSIDSDDDSDSTNSIQKLLQSLINSLAESYDENDSTSSSDNKTDAISSLVSSADTDKSEGLSADELASVDSSGNAGKAGFVNDLISNFKSYDTDGDGQLSQTEIEAVKPKEQLANDTEQLETSLENLSSTFIKKLLSNYQNSNLSSLTPSLSIAG